MLDEQNLRAFGRTIGRLSQGESLSREEAKEAFRQVLANEQPELHQGAFLAALAAKGETPEEIAGSWEAIYELDTVKATPSTPAPLVENSGTGMDALKTFNISTAAAIVAAAGGVRMAKHGARAITSACGAVDIAEALGVDVECPPDVVVRSIEDAQIGLFNGMSQQVHPHALPRILSQIRFGSTLNIAASLANPASPRFALRGVYSSDMVAPTAEVMREIGYEHALVVHGRNGDDAHLPEQIWMVREQGLESGDDELRPGFAGVDQSHQPQGRCAATHLDARYPSSRARRPAPVQLGHARRSINQLFKASDLIVVGPPDSRIAHLHRRRPDTHGGLRLDEVGVGAPGSDRAIHERVLALVRRGQLPLEQQLRVRAINGQEELLVVLTEGEIVFFLPIDAEDRELIPRVTLEHRRACIPAQLNLAIDCLGIDEGYRLSQ